MRERYIAKKLPNGNVDLVRPEDMDAWVAKNYPDRGKGSSVKFKRPERGSWVWRDGKLIQRSAQILQFSKGRGLQVIKDIEPFQNVAVDNGYIGGRRQRRDMMKAHNFEEVGTEKPINRKQHDDFRPREFAEDIKHAARSHGLDWL